MKLILAFLISLIFFENTITLKTIISSKDQYIYSSPYIIRDSNSNQAYLIAFFYEGNLGCLKIFSNRNTEILSKIIKTQFMNRYLCFFYDNDFYFFSGKLYRFNAGKMELDSITLGRDDYKSVGVINLSGSSILYAKSDSNVDLYKLTDFKLFKSVKSKYGKPDLVRTKNNILVYQNDNNELFAYNINDDKIIWKLNTGKASAKLLGITLGSFNNFITAYRIVDFQNESYLYVATVIGDLYKLDPLSGKVLIKKERFRGDDNNSGLITDLQYADMNGDGFPDLVGPSVDYNVYCLNGKDLSIIWQYDTGYENQSPVTLSDVNNDGILEVFNVNDKMTLTVLDGRTGEKKLAYQIDEEKNQTRPLVGYYYDNKILNIIVKANDREIKIYNVKGI